MRVLLTNNTLDMPAGTEVYTYTLALHFVRLGVQVACVSRHHGLVAKKLRDSGIPVLKSPNDCPFRPDIIHAHHLLESARAFAQFPDVPMILVVHGILPWQEQPLALPPNIVRYIAVSEKDVQPHDR